MRVLGAPQVSILPLKGFPLPHRGPLVFPYGASRWLGGPSNRCKCLFCLGGPSRLGGLLLLSLLETESRRKANERAPPPFGFRRRPGEAAGWVAATLHQQQQKQQQVQQQHGICAESLLRGLKAAAPLLPVGALLRLSWALPALTDCNNSSSSCYGSALSWQEICNGGRAPDRPLQVKSRGPPAFIIRLPQESCQQQQQLQQLQQEKQQQQEQQQQPQQAGSWREEKRSLNEVLLWRLSAVFLVTSPETTTAAAAGGPSLLVRAASGVSRLLPRSKRLIQQIEELPPVPAAAAAAAVRALVNHLGLLAATAGPPGAPMGGPSSIICASAAAADTPAAAAKAAAAIAPWALCWALGPLSLKDWALLLSAYCRLLLLLPTGVREPLQQFLLQVGAPAQEASPSPSVFGDSLRPLIATAPAAPAALAPAAAAAEIGRPSSWFRRDVCSILQGLAKLHEGLLLSLSLLHVSPLLSVHLAAAAARLAAAAAAGPTCICCSSSDAAASSPGGAPPCSNSDSSSCCCSMDWLQQEAVGLAADAASCISAMSVQWGLWGPPSFAAALEQQWVCLRAALAAVAAADSLATSGALGRGAQGPLPSSLGRQAVAGVLAAAAAAESAAAAAAKAANSLQGWPLEGLLAALPLPSLRWLDKQVRPSSPAAAVFAAASAAVLFVCCCLRL